MSNQEPLVFYTGYAELLDDETRDAQDGKDDAVVFDSSQYDNLPEFIVSAEGEALDLSGKDKRSILSHPFHGAPNQQWIISLSEDGDGQVSIQSKSNGRFIGIQKPALDASIVSTDAPYYWEVLKDGPGHKFVVPNTGLSLSLGASARLRFIEEDEGTRLYRFSNSETNRAMLKRGEIGSAHKGMATANSDVAGSLKSLQDFLSSKDVKDALGTLSQQSSPSRRPLKRRRHRVISSSDKHLTRCPGVADIVTINDQAITIIRNTAHPTKQVVPTEFVSPAWASAKHLRIIADTTGDGFGDIVGFGETGMFVALNNGDNTFGPARKVSPEFGYNKGWRTDKHIRFMADLCNSGRADVVAFGEAGVHVALSNGDGTYGPAKSILPFFGRKQGWERDKHPRFLADMDGTGNLDIVGFGTKCVWIARGNGDGTFQPAEELFSDMTHSTGWYLDRHPRFLADMTGDGTLDLVGFGDEGVYVAFNAGRGRFLPMNLVCRQFGGKSDFRMDETYRFVADLTGNGCADLLAIGKTGIFVALNNGQGAFPSRAKKVSTHFCIDAGWLSTVNNPRMLVDMTGNGRPDIIGVGSNGIYVLYNDGEGNFTRKEQFIDGIGSAEPGWAGTLVLPANLTPA